MKIINPSSPEKIMSTILLPSCENSLPYFQHPSFSKSSFGEHSTNNLSLREKLKQLFVQKQNMNSFSVKERMKTFNPTYTNKISWELVEKLQDATKNSHVNPYYLNNLAQYSIKTGLYDLTIIEGMLSNPSCDSETIEIIFEKALTIYTKKAKKMNFFKIAIPTNGTEKIAMQLVLEKPNNNHLYRIALSKPAHSIDLLIHAPETPSWVLDRIFKYLHKQTQQNYLSSIYLLLHPNFPRTTIISSFLTFDDHSWEILKKREDWKNIVPFIVEHYYPEININLPNEWLEEFLDQMKNKTLA